MHEIPVGAPVFCSDGPGGEITAVIMNPVSRMISHIGVKSGVDEYLVPIDAVVESSATEVRLNCTRDEVRNMELFAETHYVPSAGDGAFYGYGDIWDAPYATTSMDDFVVQVDEMIPPGELAVRRGDRVEATDGPVGTVEEFLIDGESHRVTHMVVAETHAWGKRLISIPIGLIDNQDETDVIRLKLDSDGVHSLPGLPIKRHYGSGRSAGQPHLVAYIFTGAETAAETAEYLDKQPEKSAVQSMAILTRDGEGKTRLHDSANPSLGKSRFFGALAGGLAGLLAGPVGALLGAVVGAGIGDFSAKHIDLGLSKEFLSGLQEHLDKDTSALVVVVDAGEADRLSGVLAGAKGVILQETLTEEGLEALVSPAHGDAEDQD